MCINTPYIREWQLEGKNMRYLIGFAFLLPMVVFAKDPPLPDALLNAKTAFVEKVITAQESFDKYCRASRANADANVNGG
jgi:hypothetical protein